MRRDTGWLLLTLGVVALLGWYSARSLQPASFPLAPVETTGPYGLKYRDLVKGQGVVVQDSDELTVSYTGSLPNGKVFDTSSDHHQLFTFSLNEVIPGWQFGLVGMRVGGRRRLVIPPNLAYFDHGLPAGQFAEEWTRPESCVAIPGNSTVIFDVKLLGTKDTSLDPRAPPPPPPMSPRPFHPFSPYLWQPSTSP